VDVQKDLSGEAKVLASLTGKQREVLDLLIEHKTSKEIGRRLGISPHTVDQRIQFAKDKLGARTRNEAAAAYRRLREICEQTTYGNSGVAEPAPLADENRGARGSLPASSKQGRFRSRREEVPEADFLVGPEMFDGRHGTLLRLGAIFAIALCLVLVALGGVAMFTQLSQLMAS
jgi:DNA-binding CsgD family transcriptional regulator